MDVEEQAQDTPLDNPPSRVTFFQRTYPPIPTSLSLHSSINPSPEEETTIRENIDNINTALSSVDEEISLVRAKLLSLEAYRSTLRTTLAHQHASLSPIRRLPPEIFGEIFLFASASSTIVWPRTHFAPQQDDMPWVLCNVCSHWRTMAISFPRLWSNIRLDLVYINPHRIENVRSFLRLCLSRSKAEPLTLSFEVEGSSHFLSILDLLISHSERWKDISLTGNVFFDFQDYLALLKNRTPNLLRLCIETDRHNMLYHTPQLRPLEAFEDAQNLRELSITHVVYPLQNFRVPWSQLTHFKSKGCTFREGEFTQVMRHMTNLVAFSTEGERILEVSSTVPVLLPHLRQLDIINKGSYISWTCQFLTVPNLDVLSIRAGTQFIAEQTVAMIERSGCKPKHLALRSSLDAGAAGDENTNVVRLLTALPSLTRLELGVTRAAVLIVPRLTHQGGRSRLATSRTLLLPELDSLVLEDYQCTSEVEIADALSWRISNGVRPGLRSIDLRLFPPVRPALHELDELKRVAESHRVKISISSD